MSIARIHPEITPGLDKTGGGSNDGGMEARVAALEASVKHIETDVHEIKADLRSIIKYGIGAFMVTWGGLIAVALGLAFIMAKGFKWLS